jgi:excisionase family DNA binding protein
MKANQTETVDLAGPALWTKDDAARFLKVNIRTIESWMALGILPYYKIGRRTVRFKPEALQAHLDRTAEVVNGVRARLNR